MLRATFFDGVGYWLVTRRLSQGRIQWWPTTQEAPVHPLIAQQLAVLLYDGLPEEAKFAPAWRKLVQPNLQAARSSSSALL
jgi:hypothetical protein